MRGILRSIFDLKNRVPRGYEQEAASGYVDRMSRLTNRPERAEGTPYEVVCQSCGAEVVVRAHSATAAVLKARATPPNFHLTRTTLGPRIVCEPCVERRPRPQDGPLEGARITSVYNDDVASVIKQIEDQ